MSFNTIILLANSEPLKARIIACAAKEGIPDPETWVRNHSWEFGATPGWDNKWESAKASKTTKENPNFGERDDVISDGDILAAVQALKTR